MCVTNGTARVDHKKIARRLGVAHKRVRLATRDETLAHAGFAPGTVPPFGHRAKLRTFVAVDLTTRFDPDDVVYGGGGCVDVEVRCTVRDLLRLTNGEVMDVKRDDDVMNDAAADGTRPDVVAGAGSDADAAGDDRTLRARRGGAGVATPGDDARVLPVDPALDERVGPARLPIAKRVADVMGRPPEMESEDDVESGEISSSSFFINFMLPGLKFLSLTHISSNDTPDSESLSGQFTVLGHPSLRCVSLIPGRYIFEQSDAAKAHERHAFPHIPFSSRRCCFVLDFSWPPTTYPTSARKAAKTIDGKIAPARKCGG